MRVPFADLKSIHAALDSEMASAFQRVMESGWYVLGREVENFEIEFARYCGVNYCIGVGNGLDALTLMLQAYRVGFGDEVIVPANTYIATWLAISRSGATIVPVEPDEHSFNIDPSKIESSITPKTVAIMPVHFYGRPAEMSEINVLAKKYGLLILADAAQAHGALYKNNPICALSDASATSFYPGKNLGAVGDAGAILTNDREIAEKVKKLRSYGSSVKYRHTDIGVNSRLDELQAAFLRAKLPYLDAWNECRIDIARQYSQSLKEFPSLECPLFQLNADIKSVWHQYVIKHKERDRLQQHLLEMGVETMIHYPVPPYRQKCYADRFWPSLPLTDVITSDILSLPIFPTLRKEDVAYVIESIRSFN